MHDGKLMAGVILITLGLSLVPANDQFWEAMHALDFDYAKNHQLSSNQNEFSRLLELSVAGEYEQTQAGFKTLMMNSDDSMVAANSGMILSELWRIQSDWQAFVDAESYMLITGDNTLSLVREFAEAPVESWVYSDQSITVPVTMSVSGTPVIEVEVNGKRKNFWIDTGAALSIVSTDVAGECEIKPLGNNRAKVQTGTSRKLNVEGAVIDSLKIGSVAVYNHPVMMVESKHLEIKIPGKSSTVKIDGIIGYNALQKMDITIDYYHNHLTIDKPVKKQSVDRNRNLFWMGVPIAKTLSPDGKPLFFFIDTGANRTALYESIFEKIHFPDVDSQQVTISSAGGAERIYVKKVPDLRVSIGDYTLILDNLLTVPQTVQSFVVLDGIIGSDAFKTKAVHIDHINGLFEVSP